MSYKEDKKNITSLDRFQMAAYQGLGWVVKRKRIILWSVIPVCSMLLIGFGVQWWTASRAQTRRTELASIDVAFSKEALAAQKLRDPIQAEVMKLAESAKNTESTENPQDVSPQNKAAMEAKQLEMEAIKPNHEATLKSYQEFFERYPKDPEGWKAAMSIVHEKLQNKDFQGSVDLLKKILQGSQSSEFYQRQVRLQYAAVLEELGQYEEGIQQVDQVLAFKDDTYAPKALLAKARLFIWAQKKAEALQTLDQLIQQHALSEEAQKAKGFKAVL